MSWPQRAAHILRIWLSWSGSLRTSGPKLIQDIVQVYWQHLSEKIDARVIKLRYLIQGFNNFFTPDLWMFNVMLKNCVCVCVFTCDLDKDQITFYE